MNPLLKLAPVAALCLAGCADEVLSTQDTVTLRAGNAMNANRAIQTIDPQASRADRTGIPGDGVRIARDIKAFREGDGSAEAPQILNQIGSSFNGPLPPDASGSP